MTTNIQKVEAFIAAWNEGNGEHIIAAFTPDAIYHNIPMPAVEGKDRIAGTIRGLLAAMTEIDWRIMAIAQAGDGSVLTERVDAFVMGGRRISLPVMGIFEFQDGSIRRWADYFDLESYQRQLAGTDDLAAASN